MYFAKCGLTGLLGEKAMIDQTEEAVAVENMPYYLGYFGAAKAKAAFCPSHPNNANSLVLIKAGVPVPATQAEVNKAANAIKKAANVQAQAVKKAATAQKQAEKKAAVAEKKQTAAQAALAKKQAAAQKKTGQMSAAMAAATKDMVKEITTKIQPTIDKVNKMKGAPKSKAAAAQLQAVVNKFKTTAKLSGLSGLDSCCGGSLVFGLDGTYLTDCFDQNDITCVGSPAYCNSNPNDSVWCTPSNVSTSIYQPTPLPMPKGCEKNPNKPACLLWTMETSQQQTNAMFMSLIQMIMDKFDTLMQVLLSEQGTSTGGCDPNDASCLGSAAYCAMYPNDVNYCQAAVQQQLIPGTAAYCAAYPTDYTYCQAAVQQQQYYQQPTQDYYAQQPVYAQQQQQQQQQQQYYPQQSQMAPGFEPIYEGVDTSGLPSDYVPAGSVQTAQQQYYAPVQAQQQQYYQEQTPTFYTEESVAASEIFPGSSLVPDYGYAQPQQQYYQPSAQMSLETAQAESQIPSTMDMNMAVSESIGGDDWMY